MNEVKKLTINDYKLMKERGEVISWISIYDYPMAYYADQAGIDTIFVGDSSTMTVLGYPNTLSATMDQMIMFAGAVSRAVKRAFIIGDLPYMSYQISKSEAVRNAGRYMSEGHVDAVKCEGGVEVADTIAEIVKWGIPCHGHIGVTPQSLSAQGGYKSQGRSTEDAVRLVNDALCLEQAGCFCLVIECVPQQITQLIRERLTIPIISIGGGPADGQLLIVQDLLGMWPGHKPKFVKAYANLGEQMLHAFKTYNAEVKGHVHPAPEQCYNISDELLDKVKDELRRRGI
jgi:3-methyl-2-oxobutanoate hydroxymethyltransferase